ncbi:MAG: zinc-binding dehydrogenase [Deltaproteobacteria bacterium]|nr:zinc-binding dehydrogenase [Deltaproteobacteria bacterium]
MQAVGFQEHGDAGVLQLLDLPDPTPGAGQVVVDIRAVAVNHLDIWVRRGWPGLNLPRPFILGSDMAGVIRSVSPDVTAWKPGDEVIVSPGTSCGVCRYCLSGEDSVCARYGIHGETQNGGYTQQFRTSASHLLAKPLRLTFPEAASFPLTFLTAWRMLMVRAQVRPGESVLVMGASAGVSVAGIQLCKLAGATVIAATGDDDKAQRARALGADHVVDSRGELKKQVGALVGREGVDLVFEHVGGPSFRAALGVLRKGGRLVTCGATSGSQVEMDLRHIFFKQQSIIGSTMGSRADLLAVTRLFEQGRLRPVVDQVLPLAEAARAHTLLEERKHFGKVVLAP